MHVSINGKRGRAVSLMMNRQGRLVVVLREGGDKASMALLLRERLSQCMLNSKERSGGVEGERCHSVHGIVHIRLRFPHQQREMVVVSPCDGDVS